MGKLFSENMNISKKNLDANSQTEIISQKDLRFKRFDG